MKLEVADAAVAEIAKAGFDPVYGRAAAEAGAIQQQIENPIARLVLEGRFGPKDIVPVDFPRRPLYFDDGALSRAVDRRAARQAVSAAPRPAGLLGAFRWLEACHRVAGRIGKHRRAAVVAVLEGKAVRVRCHLSTPRRRSAASISSCARSSSSPSSGHTTLRSCVRRAGGADADADLLDMLVLEGVRSRCSADGPMS